MSLVERALDRIRNQSSADQRAAAHTAAPSAIGSLLDAASPSDSGTRIAINRAALRAAGYLPEEDQDRRFADEYRQIKRPLLTKAFAGEVTHSGKASPRLIMMASALPGDGKTFTSINLALSLAREKDTSVVLVDADVAKPHISQIFGVENERGLLDALAEPAVNASSLVLATDVKGLSVMPAGKSHEGATELLASGRMADVAAQILARNPRSVALFDSPPLLVSSESRALAAAMGQIVVVARAGHTPRQAVLDALAELPQEQSASLVLNQSRRSFAEKLYGYGEPGSYGKNG